MPIIVLDAMGSDKHPEPELQAVVEAAQLFGDEIILTGSEAILAPKLAALGAKNVRLVDAPEVFEMTDKISPGALKRAKNSSASFLATPSMSRDPTCAIFPPTCACAS